MRRSLLICAALAVANFATAQTATTIVRDVYLIAGQFPENRQPDGNSVVVRGSKGLIAIDTGRHASHTRQIVAFADELHEPVVAIVNTHWHLDHVGGNVILRDAYPRVEIYASDGMRSALGGFLRDYRAQLEQAIASAKPDQDVAPWRAEISLIDAGARLAPTRIVEDSSDISMAGRRLTLHLERNAVSAGDVWVEDPQTKVVVSGDLVTLPVPFFDTACAIGWETALAHVAAAQFNTLIPGHGPPLTRTQFQTYRHAFSALLTCARSHESSAGCASRWMDDAGTLVAEGDRTRVEPMIDYYFKASVGGDEAARSRFCGTTNRDSR